MDINHWLRPLRRRQCLANERKTATFAPVGNGTFSIQAANPSMKVYFSETQVFTRKNHPAFLPTFEPPEIIQRVDPSKIRKKSLSEHIRYNFFRMLGGRSTWTQPTSKIDGHSLKRILLFRYDAIGDFIVSTPVIRWLATALPHVKIDIVTSYRNDALVRNDPFVCHTFPIHPGHNAHVSWIDGVRKTKPYNYDLILGLVFTRMTKCAILASAIAPEAEKITILHDRRQLTYGLVFNRQVPHHDWREHWSTTMLRVVTDNITPVAEPVANASHPYIVLEEEAWNKVQQRLADQQIGYDLPDNGNVLQTRQWKGAPPSSRAGYPYCIVNISAFTKNRQWNSDACMVVCRSLVDAYPSLCVFVTGAPDARTDIEDIAARVGNPRCMPLSVSLMEVMVMVAGCSFLISPDTATLHMAAAADRPVVGLYAEYIKVAEWYPFTNAPFTILLSTNPESINAIEAEKIIAATHQLISEAALSFAQ